MNKLRFAAIMATVLMASLLPVQAASPITYQYTYDAAGQLTSAIDSTGVVLQYVYDSAARLIQTTRTAPGGPLSVLGVSPASGVAGTAVTILGSGFSAVAANNVVTFNGVAAVVTAATANTLTVTVPATAATGVISVTTGGATADSPSAFQVVALPQITGISTRYLLAGQTGVTINVTGINLTGSTFSVQPSTVPPAITIDNALATATSATLTVSTAALALNAVIVATNAAGSSSIVPALSNSLTLLLPALDSDGDGLSNADELNLYHTDPLNPDTDGDGMPDGWEVHYGLNPVDPTDAAKLSKAGDGLTNLQEFLGGTDPTTADRTVPAVTSFTPSANGTGIPVNTVISLNFNVPVLSGAKLSMLAALNSHISAPAFSLSSSGGPVAGAVNISFSGVTFVPAQDLNANTTYTLTASGFRTSASGVLQTTTFTSTFTTGTQRDTTQPTVIRTSPSTFRGTVTTITAVPTNALISIEFSKPMDPATFTSASFQLSSNNAITYAPITGRYIADSTRLIATFIPDLPLPVGSQISVNLDTQAIKDIAGNTLATDAGLSFQTGFGPNTTPPAIGGFSPRNGDTGIPANAQIVVGFSKPVSEIAAVRAITVTANGSAVPGSFSFLNNDLQAVFIPTNPLVAGAATARVSTGLTDVAGNALTASSSATFTVDSPANTVPLTITSLSPPDGATAGLNAILQAAFSARIDPLTLVLSLFRTVTVNQNPTPFPVAGATVVSSDRLSAAFTPSQPLLATTQYCWAVSAADLAGNSVTSPQSCFTTTAASDTAPPTITGVNPPTNSTNVPLNAVIAALASKPLSPVSVANNSATAISLSVAGTPVAGVASLSADGRTLVFNPAAQLTANVTYTLAVAGVTDYEGNTITPFSSTFTAGTAADSSGLNITGVAPADGTPDVPVNSAVVISFDKLLNPLSANSNTVQVSVSAKNVILAGSYSVDNSGAGGIISFKPSAPFPGGASILININGVQDFAGNAANGATSFTTAATADTTPPAVTSVTPTNGSTGLGQNTLVSLTFSEPLNPTTIGPGTFALFNGTTRLSTTVGSSQDFQTVTLAASIPANAIISVTATSDVQDLAGNSLGGFTSSFSTAAVNVTSPTITGQRPAFGASPVPVTAPIVLFASKPLNPSTVNGALHIAVNGQPVAGTVTLSSNNQGVQFTPAAPWSPGTTIQIFLDSTATDTNGNAMVNYQGSFTTATVVTGVVPTLVSMVPNNGSASSNPLIEVQFNEPLDASTLSANISLSSYPGNAAVPTTASLVTPQVIKVTPASALAPNTTYILAIATGLKDATGHPLSFENDLSFTTGAAADTAQPRVVDITPPDTSSNIGTNVPIEIRFDKPINPLSVSTATIQIMAAGVPVGPVSISFNNNQSGFINQNVQIVPIGLLPDSSHVTVSVSGIQDLSGNTVVPVSIGFNTGAGFDFTIPAVTSTNPISGETGVPTNSIITIQFDKPIDPYSINAQSIQVVDNVIGYVAGAYSLSANALQMSFAPNTPLAVGRTYTVYIASNGDVHDLAGNTLPYSTFSFTAGFGAATSPHVILTDPLNTLSSVPVNSVIQILFDEPLQSASINSVSLSTDGAVVAGTVNSLSLGNTVLTITPPALLRGSTAYSINIAGVTDLAGNAMGAPVTTTFTTAPGARLTTTTYAADPPDGAANIGINVVPAIFATAPLDPISINSSSLQLFSPDLNMSSVPISGVTATAADRMSATFMPSAPLKPTTRYCLKVLGITDDTGAAINEGGAYYYLNSTCFVTGAGTDTTRPTVTSVSPPDTSTNVPANVSITILTSKPINASSVKSGSIILASGGSSVPGIVTVASDSETITFQPSATLAPGANYTLTVSGFADFDGNLVVPFTSRFQTDSTGVPDLTQPTVISTAPADGSAGVANSGPVSITFSKPVNPISVNLNTIAFTLPSGAQLGGTLAASGAVVTFTPATPLPANATITGTVNNVSNVLDFAGNAAQSYSFSFTAAASADTAAPAITSITPAGGSTNMGPSAVVTVIFSKSLDPSTINNTNFGLFAGTTRLTLNSLTSSQDHTIVSMNAGPLPASSTITAVITHGVLDLSGNALHDFTSSFTTAAIDSSRPQVSLYRPGYGSSSVPANASIEIFFTTPMDPTSASGAVTVSQNGSVIAGTAALTGGGQTLTFTPSTPFPQGAVVQVFAGSSAMDLLGNQLMPANFSFSVASDLTGTPPSVTGSSPNGLAPLNTVIQVQFNKPLDPATVNSTALLLTTSPGGSQVPGSVTLVGDRTIQMIPASALQPSADYMYSIPATVADKTGLGIGQAFTGYFSTGSSADTTQPRVVAVTPPDASTGIGDNAPVKVQFSEPINQLTATAATIQMQVNGSTVTPVSVTYDSLPSVTITPFSPFPDNAKVTVSVAGVLDAAGNAVVPFTSSFTTGAVPVLSGHVLRTSPVPNAVNVPRNAIITLETDDPVDPATVNSNGFVVSDASGPLAGTYSISASGKVISFAPSAPFAASDKISFYDILLDLEGNSLSVYDASGKVIIGDGSFTTSSAVVAAPPSVTLVNPPNGLANVPTDVVPQLLFNEPLNASTIGAITLSHGGTNLALTRTIGNGNQTVSLIPPGLLQPSTVYTITVGAVADTAGNIVTSPVQFSFTTGTGASLGIPSVVSYSPANNATGVPLSATVSAVFSAPLNPLTLNATSFAVYGSGYIAGSLSLSADGLTVTFTPSVPLNPNSNFEIVISNGSALTDIAGNAFAASGTFFTTGAQ